MNAADLAQYLQTNGHGTIGTDIFINYQPEEPDQIIVVSDYTVDEPMNTMSQAVPLVERPRIQVLVRDAPQEALAAYTKIRTIYNAMCLVMDMTINSKRYTLVPVSTPQMIARDKQQRVLYTTNYQASVQ